MARVLPDHVRCKGTATTTGERCKNARLKGATVCRKHGAAAPQVREAAARRVAAEAVRADAAALLAAEGVGLVGDPYEALRGIAAEVLALKMAAARRVNALGEEIRFVSFQGAEQLRSEVALYERAVDRAAKILETLAKLGLDERRVRVSEAIGERVADAIESILDELGLSADQRAVAPAVVSRHLLRLVDAA